MNHDEEGLGGFAFTPNEDGHDVDVFGLCCFAAIVALAGMAAWTWPLTVGVLTLTLVLVCGMVWLVRTIREELDSEEA